MVVGQGPDLTDEAWLTLGREAPGQQLPQRATWGPTTKPNRHCACTKAQPLRQPSDSSRSYVLSPRSMQGCPLLLLRAVSLPVIAPTETTPTHRPTGPVVPSPSLGNPAPPSP